MMDRNINFKPSARYRASTTPVVSEPEPEQVQQGGSPAVRAASLFGVMLILFSVLATLPIQNWLTAKKYQLNAETLSLVGDANADLAKKLALNPQEGVYQFNPEAKKLDPSSSNDPNVVAQLLAKRQQQKTVVGDTKDAGLYSLDLPIDASKGMTFTDNNANISFKMTPMFEKGAGRKTQDRLVYPIEEGIKAVYTVKNNGLKEDIVYEAAPANGSASYSYKLELPDSLEARLTDDGGMGIYSADPSLFGDISFGSDEDRVKVESARQSAPKDHLVFALPKPVIVAKDNQLGNSSAWFTLGNNILTVNARDLNTIQGSFSIDPSVVITSTTDFSDGNNEGGIEFGTNEIKRSGVSGGRLGDTWSTLSNLPAALSEPGTVAYNGYIYAYGGYTGSVQVNTTYYAQIMADGTLGAWNTGPTLPATLTRMGVAAYNGYIYSFGGFGSGAVTAAVYYSKIGAGGVPGTWVTTTSLPAGVQSQLAAVYNGHLYSISGNNAAAGYVESYYAPIRANGTVGTWVATTSTPVSYSNADAVAYNGYIYGFGGYNGSAVVATVYYAKINANGTLGTWSTTTSLPIVLEQVTAAVHNGYVYAMAGDGGSAGNNIVRYAPINGDGTIGRWIQTTNIPVATTQQSGVMYNGYFYKLGGITPGYVATVYGNKVQPVGFTSTYAETTSLPTVTSKGKLYARDTHQAVAYRGFLYVLGGYGATAPLNDVYYAPINADGTIGAWTQTTSFGTARDGLQSVVVNGYMYVIGGFGATARVADVEYALICTGLNNGTGGCTATAGTLGTWTTTTFLPSARSSHRAVETNGYIYVLGGTNGTTWFNETLSALVCTGSNSGVGGCTATAGTLGTWTTTTAFTNGREKATATLANGYIYLVGGFNGTLTFADTQYALVCTGSNSGVGGCTATAGTVGTWTAGPSLPANRANHTAVFDRGFIYLFGGIPDGTAGTTGVTADVQFAAVNTTGGLSAWATNTALATTLNGHASALANGRIYHTGGLTPNPTEKVTYASIHNGGSGMTGSWATSANSMLHARSGHGLVVYKGYLYALGGTTTTAVTEYAQILADGSVGPWTATASLLTAAGGFSATVANGYVYMIAGYNGTANIAKVQYAKINDNGGLQAFQYAANDYPLAVGNSKTVSYKGFLYGVGGSDAGFRSEVYVASLNTSTGAVGTWSAATAFAQARDNHTATVYGDYMYVSGGFGSGGVINDMQFTKINTDGTLGSWQRTPVYPHGRYAASMTAYNGFMYVTQGQNGSQFLNDAYYAPINSNGSLGAWHPAGTVPVSFNYSHVSVAHNGRMYITGGDISNAKSATVQSAGLNSIQRLARYSKLVDVGTLASVSNIGYTGTLPNGKGDITFKFAGLDGIFGASASATTLGGTCGTSVTARYILLTVDMNDSSTGIFQDVNGTLASIQDITVDSITAQGNPVDPAKRLRGGKFFDAVTGLQPLDTAKVAVAGAGC